MTINEDFRVVLRTGVEDELLTILKTHKKNLEKWCGVRLELNFFSLSEGLAITLPVVKSRPSKNKETILTLLDLKAKLIEFFESKNKGLSGEYHVHRKHVVLNKSEFIKTFEDQNEHFVDFLKNNSNS